MTAREKHEKRKQCVEAILNVCGQLHLVTVGRLADLMMTMWESGEIKRNLDRRKSL